MLERLVGTDDPPLRIARDVARTPRFEALHKEARTLDVMRGGAAEADPGYVGLPDLDPARPFDAQFRDVFAPRLGKRAEGFAAIFAALRTQGKPLILETGCLRIPGNWAGDGQSTFLFDTFARDADGLVWSVDITAESLDAARRACSSATSLVLNDSVAALHAMSRTMRGTVGLLYLDSFDLDRENPMPSAIHHAMELIAARPLIGPGTVICVDDYDVPGVAGGEGGKGLIVDRFLSGIRARVLHSGYQKVWQIP